MTEPNDDLEFEIPRDLVLPRPGCHPFGHGSVDTRDLRITITDRDPAEIAAAVAARVCAGVRKPARTCPVDDRPAHKGYPGILPALQRVVYGCEHCGGEYALPNRHPIGGRYTVTHVCPDGTVPRRFRFDRFIGPGPTGALIGTFTVTERELP